MIFKNNNPFLWVLFSKFSRLRRASNYHFQEEELIFTGRVFKIFAPAASYKYLEFRRL